MLCQWGINRLINLISNHYTTITRFHAHHRFEADHVIRWNQAWKRRSFPTMKGRQRNQVTLCQAPKALPNFFNGWGDSWQNSIRLSPTWSSHPVHSWCGPWPSPRCTYSCHEYGSKGCSGANPNSWTPIGENGIHSQTLKKESRLHNKAQHT